MNAPPLPRPTRVPVTKRSSSCGGASFDGAVAIFASMTNIVSGFLITDRMLKMFKKKDRGAAK